MYRTNLVAAPPVSSRDSKQMLIGSSKYADACRRSLANTIEDHSASISISFGLYVFSESMKEKEL